MVNPDRELLRTLPKVLRARDFYLYLEGGKRIMDLWLEGGKAILGHKPSGVLRELKNAGERGLFSSLPHFMEGRFIKAMGLLFPGRVFRLYPDEATMYKALESSGLFNEKQSALWRPFLETPDEIPAAGKFPPVLIPIVPWPLGPAALVLDKSAEASFPQNSLIPPVLLAPATRAIYDLIAVMKAEKPSRGGKKYPKINKALSETSGDKPGKPLWRRRLIYLYTNPALEKEKYALLFKKFLEGGFLIPPDQGEPVILPPLMSNGEESKLAELLRIRL